MFHNMTAITRSQMAGDKPAERDMTDRRGLAKRKADRANNTKPARTRDGQTYPGGRIMRRVLARSAALLSNHKPSPDRTAPGSRRP